MLQHVLVPHVRARAVLAAAPQAVARLAAVLALAAVDAAGPPKQVGYVAVDAAVDNARVHVAATRAA